MVKILMEGNLRELSDNEVKQNDLSEYPKLPDGENPFMWTSNNKNWTVIICGDGKGGFTLCLSEYDNNDLSKYGYADFEDDKYECFNTAEKIINIIKSNEDFISYEKICKEYKIDQK